MPQMDEVEQQEANSKSSIKKAEKIKSEKKEKKEKSEKKSKKKKIGDKTGSDLGSPDSKDISPNPERNVEDPKKSTTNGNSPTDFESLDKIINSKQQELDQVYKSIEEHLNKMQQAISTNDKSTIIACSEQSAKSLLKAEEIKSTLYKLRLKIIEEDN